MKKTTKRHIITTGDVNSYGYRVLSAGVDFSQYVNNPIMLWMHKRADSNNKDQILPLGRVIEIRLEGDAWTGQPEFDESDTFAMSIYNKYQTGVLSMLSLGAAPIEVSDDPKYMLSGQTQPTVTKCKAIEISCVDIGSNDQALPVELYDTAGQSISLSYGSIGKYLKLAKQSKLFKADNHKQTTVDVVENGVAAGKLTETMASALLSLDDSEQSVQHIFDFVKASKINPDRLEGKLHKQVLPLVTKNWRDLKNVAGDGTKILKEHAPEVYKAKFFEQHDRMPGSLDGKLA